jgi:hypothetical protein
VAWLARVRDHKNVLGLGVLWLTFGVCASPLHAEETLGHEFLDPPRPKPSGAEVSAPKDEKENAGYIPGYRRFPSVGLSPEAPQNVPGLPGLITPAFGAPVSGSELRFEFHGYLATALRMGIGKRDTVYEGQQRTTLHADPIVPGGAYGWLDHTNIVPRPWSQLAFQYGNDTVRGTAILGTWSLGRARDATGYAQTGAQIWLNDAFLVYTPNLAPFGLALTAGVYNDQYGQMARYSNGQYGVPLMGSIRGMGVKAALQIPIQGGIDMTVEGGFKGGLDRVPVGIAIDSTTNFPRPEEGSTYAAHGHVAMTWNNVTLALHDVHSWSQDDVYTPPDDPLTVVDESSTRPDGSLDIVGVDVRADLARFGHAYLGASKVTGKDTLSVSNLVQVLDSAGGRDFMERFWGFGSGGNSELTLVGGEYTLSLATLSRHPEDLRGVGPDFTLTLFGLYAHSSGGCDQFSLRVDGTECVPGGIDGEFDVHALKYGVEGIYGFSQHALATLRIDHVHPNLDRDGPTFAAITPRLIFRSDWITRENVGIQYTGFLFGDDVAINGDSRLVNTNSQNPDRHLVALFATMYW